MKTYQYIDKPSLEFARTDPNRSAISMINEFDNQRSADLETAHNNALKQDKKKIEAIRQAIAERALQPKAVDGSGQVVPQAEYAEQVAAQSSGALDR